MLVLPTDITVDQRQTVISEFEEVLKEAKADIYHTDDWGKRELAYDIKGREEAYYLIYYINLQDTSKIQEITNNLRIQANLLRYLIVKEILTMKFKILLTKMNTKKFKRIQIKLKTKMLLITKI